MLYTYTEKNLLELPEKYMYSKYHGIQFIKDYFECRNNYLKSSNMSKANNTHIDCVIFETGLVSDKNMTHISIAMPIDINFAKNNAFTININDNDICKVKSDLLQKVNIEDEVDTLDLLVSLICSLIIGQNIELTKKWLDRLVQRFEVSKKLHTMYYPGFRKGNNETTSIYIYWLFLLGLNVTCTRNLHLPYLNTILKVSDLLCSLPCEMVKKSLPDKGMQVVVCLEKFNINKLMTRNALSLDV